MGQEGCFFLYELTRENINPGSTIVADSANDINLVRNTLRDLAILLNVSLLEVGMLCSGKK